MNFIKTINHIKRIILIIITFILCSVTGYINLKYYNGIDMYANQYGNPILMLISSFFGTLFIISVSSYINLKVIKYIGKNSLIYFIMHQFVFVCLSYLVEGLFKPYGNSVLYKLLENTIYILVSLLIITVVNNVLIRTPLATLFGLKRIQKTKCITKNEQNNSGF